MHSTHLIWRLFVVNHHRIGAQVWHVFSRDFSFTCTPTRSSAIGMSHTCLCIPSYNWYLFTDPGGMEGWVHLDANLRSIPGRDSNLQPPSWKSGTVPHCHVWVTRVNAMWQGLLRVGWPRRWPSTASVHRPRHANSMMYRRSKSNHSCFVVGPQKTTVDRRNIWSDSNQYLIDVCCSQTRRRRANYL